MSTRILFIISLLLIVIASYFYASNDASLSKVKLKPTDIDYQANNIRALQTNEQGAIYYQMTADKVIHYQYAKMAILENPNIVWLPSPERKVIFQAVRAELDENQQIIHLKDNVMMQNQPLMATKMVSNQALFNNQQSITLTGRDFIGDLTSKQVYTEQPMQVIQGKHQFSAQRMNANLTTGDYQFDRVEVIYSPNP